MEPTWRWFGPRDPIPLAHIRQAGVTGIVTALHERSCGEVWPVSEIEARKAEIDSAGMRWSVVESVAVHEEIKQGGPEAERYLERYRETVRNLGRAGIDTICYNFMAVTDWTRTNLSMPMPTGATALRFDKTEFACFELFQLKRRGAREELGEELCERAERLWASMDDAARDQLAKVVLMGLPGTVEDLSIDEFRRMLSCYDQIDVEQLRANHEAFLRVVIPVAEEEGVKLAIHPDDPPFSMFGLPRIASTESDLMRIVESVPSPSNGLTFCSGSLGALAANDLPGIIRRLGEHIHFLHLRSVCREDDGSFFEDDHLAGSTSMARIVSEILQLSQRCNVRLPMRPDHGHLMGNDVSENRFYAGYSYIGRLKGLAELRGLEQGMLLANRVNV